MVKNHSDSEKKLLAPIHGLPLLKSSKGSFICTIHRTVTDRIAHTMAFVTPIMVWHGELDGTIAQWVYYEGSIRRPIAPWANDFTTELHPDSYNFGGDNHCPLQQKKLNSTFSIFLVHVRIFCSESAIIVGITKCHLHINWWQSRYGKTKAKVTTKVWSNSYNVQVWSELKIL